ncbi:hypothetical protein NWP13_11395 [Rhodococcus pyridinivorans]|nr:hypothetical protein [Rhodococcus pyridinivorans]
MAIGVGLRIGRVVSTAVIASNEPGTPDPVVLARDSVLHVDHDGNTSLGSVAHGDEARTIAGFLTRVGDASGITASDGRMYRAEDAMATAIHCLLRECHPLPTFGGMDRDSDPGYAATYPSHWDPDTIATLRAALDYADLRHVDLVSDAQAAAAWYASEISETPGQLVGVFHLDDGGSTVTLVRSGVPAGKAYRTPAQGAPSPAAQLATALGSFGWMPDNLEAVVVMGDGLVARDRTHIQEIANSLATKLTVRSLVGPGPEQTAALGAAILAAGFTPARETNKTRIGLPPSYDETDVLTGGLARLRELEERRVEAETFVDARGAAEESAPVPVLTADTEEESGSGGNTRTVVIGVVAVLVLIALVAGVLL